MPAVVDRVRSGRKGVLKLRYCRALPEKFRPRSERTATGCGAPTGTMARTVRAKRPAMSQAT